MMPATPPPPPDIKPYRPVFMAGGLLAKRCCCPPVEEQQEDCLPQDNCDACSETYKGVWTGVRLLSNEGVQVTLDVELYFPMRFGPPWCFWKLDRYDDRNAALNVTYGGAPVHEFTFQAAFPPFHDSTFHCVGRGGSVDFFTWWPYSGQQLAWWVITYGWTLHLPEQNDGVAVTHLFYRPKTIEPCPPLNDPNWQWLEGPYDDHVIDPGTLHLVPG